MIRSRRPSRLRALAAGVLLLLAGGARAQADRTPLVRAVDGAGFTVADMDRSTAFYAQVLGFEKVSDVELSGPDVEHLYGLFGLRLRVVRMRLGDESVELSEYLAPRGRPVPVDSRSNDRWFQHIAIIVGDMDRAYGRLREHRVEHASSGPQRLPDWNTNAAGIEAFYFKDPDGHVLEILELPPDKGDAKWHRPSDRLFLGIDHTAIVVEDTDASLSLYRDALGLQVAGESENYGTEQEHLNNVFGARLRITTLRAGSGPAIELLEYLAPRDGRPYPADARPNDLLHWQTRLATRDVDAVARAARAGRHRFVSPGVVRLAQPLLGFRRALLFRDPDGHALQAADEAASP